RVARRQEWDERLAAFGAQTGEDGVDGVGGSHSRSSPSRRATSKQSLSPRPEKQTTTTSSFGRLAASRIVSTMACAVSSAGKMPSSREHSWKPFRASSSETLVYRTRWLSFQ